MVAAIPLAHRGPQKAPEVISKGTPMQRATPAIAMREDSHHAYDWLRERDVTVPMPDGVRLAAAVYRSMPGAAILSEEDGARPPHCSTADQT